MQYRGPQALKFFIENCNWVFAQSDDASHFVHGQGSGWASFSHITVEGDNTIQRFCFGNNRKYSIYFTQ